jgi:hypothetical protein
VSIVVLHVVARDAFISSGAEIVLCARRRPIVITGNCVGFAVAALLRGSARTVIKSLRVADAAPVDVRTMCETAFVWSAKCLRNDR